MTNVGFASLSIIPSFDGFGRNLDRGTSGPLAAAGVTGGNRFGDAAGKSAGKRFGGIFKTAAKASLIGLAGAGALGVKFGADAVAAASDLEESTNKVAQIFGKNAEQVFKFTEGAADALGQTNTQAREAAATFGIFGSAAGLADRKNAKFAKRMTVLASDLASFNNTDPSQAVEALGAALRGESEPIRAYGVMLDEATLKAEALSLGLLKPVKDQSKIFAYQVRITDLQKSYNDAVEEHGKNSLEALKAEASLGTARTALQKATEGTIPPLTQQQKLLAAQSQIFKQTNVAQGDFARTSDGLANQQRRLSARFEDAKAKLGKGLLPIISQAADFLLKEGIPAFEDFSGWFNKKGIPAIKDLGRKLRPLADELLPAAANGFKAIKGFAEDALPFAEGLVKSFNDMPGWAKKALVGGIVGGVGAKKLGLPPSLTGGGKPGSGGLLGLFTSAKPLPVFVTNPGGLGGGLPDGGGGKTGKLGWLGLSALPTAAGIAAIAGGVTAGVSKALGPGNQALLGAGSGGSGGTGSTSFFDLDGTPGLDEADGKVKEFNQKLKITQDLFYTNKEAVDEFGDTVARIPRTIQMTVTGWDVANADARAYLATLLAIRGEHMDNRLDNGPSGSAPTGDPTPPGKSGGSTNRGVNVNIGRMTVNGTKELERVGITKAHQAALGGFGA